MRPEELARRAIDAMLAQAGWAVQDVASMNLSASSGVAVREYATPAGPADYLLFLDRRAVGVIEAKPEGTTLGGVAEQSDRYLASPPRDVRTFGERLLFAYETTGAETYFRDVRDPDSRARRVFFFHRPETLLAWAREPDTFRARLRELPPLITAGLRDCQVEAIGGLERSFANARPRALVQMATGSGKTFTAVNSVYRLIKHAGARRVLFLVDRSNLGRQTLTEFQGFVTPDDGRKFTELYNVQHLETNTVQPVSKVVITTIQRLYSMLRGEAEFTPDNEERSLYESGLGLERPVDVAYNPRLPIEYFDVIITDECHRSIYNLWRQVLEYFDAFLVGLTATPSKQTFGFFNRNLVMEYGHRRAVADGVNVDYDVYRIRTRITEQGGLVEAGETVDRRDKLTRRVRWETADDDLAYRPQQLDRSVVAPDQIRTVVRAFHDALPVMFPGREHVPKTLFFAKDDSHAEDLVHAIREEFGKGNEFCKKITYRTTGEKPEELVRSFRTSMMPRIAVTVDMISTGTDIRPLECLVFMRDVRSSVYFEQMKGRGTRTINPTDLQGVTPDARHKSRFVLVDAVGVTESHKTDDPPLERHKTIAFEKLMHQVQLGARDPDRLTSLAGRLARLDRELEPPDRAAIEAATGGQSLTSVVRALVNAADPDRVVERARHDSGTDEPTPEQLERAAEALADDACRPFDDPAFRNVLTEIKRRNEQTIDTGSMDELLDAGFDANAAERARAAVTSFREYLQAHRDDITAFEIAYGRPYAERHLTLDRVRRLADGLARPPYHLTPQRLWAAYEAIERDRVRGASARRLLTDLVSLVRFAIGEETTLEPFPEAVERRYQAWLAGQELHGRMFTPEQREWLNLIKDRVADSLSATVDDLDYSPFDDRGGLHRAVKLFGPNLETILNELNEALVA